MDIFGLSFEKVVVLGVLAGLLLGPERLARIVSEGTRMLTQLRRRTDDARDAIRAELDPEFVDIDWQRLDPRRYDPRRIIADALLASPETAVRAASSPGPALDPLGAAPAVARTPEERN